MLRVTLVEKRYVLLLLPTQAAITEKSDPTKNVACLVFPVGRRRIASVKQLMALFSLTAAEARLARALCHGETLEEYALDQGVKLPTVKTQLRAIFLKHGLTGRSPWSVLSPQSRH